MTGASDFGFAGLLNENVELVVAGAPNEANELLDVDTVLGGNVFPGSFEVVVGNEGVKPPDSPLGVKPPVDGLKPPVAGAGLSVTGGVNGVGVKPVGLNPPPPDEVELPLPKDTTLPPKLKPPVGTVGIEGGGADGLLAGGGAFARSSITSPLGREAGVLVFSCISASGPSGSYSLYSSLSSSSAPSTPNPSRSSST